MTDDAYYRIGAVVKLTGLPANTIRTWERRHSIVSPVRSEGGGRLYRDEQVARLQLAAALCKAGESISAVANLSTVELRERLASHALARGHGSTPVAGVARAVLIHPTLGGQFVASRTESVRLVAQADTVDGLFAQPLNRGVDVVFVTLDAIADDPVTHIGRLRSRLETALIVVLHGFAKRNQLNRVVDTGARLLPENTRLETLAQVALDHVATSRVARRRDGPPIATPAAAPPRFTELQLARLKEMVSSVECECPNHLALLVSSLRAFEEYSRQCATDDPADERLHRYLEAGTGRARVLMEELLWELCEQDQLLERL